MESNLYRPIVQDTNVSIELDLLQVGSEPVGMRCPHCQEDVMTTATYRNTGITHLIAGVLFVFFWWMCCCIVPYVVKRWKNVEHHCPNCRKFLGIYSKTSII
nr:lipopolysaccharide-induced tumor necrosis factor-alpha factor homolog [Plodia interpunctella]